VIINSAAIINLKLKFAGFAGLIIITSVPLPVKVLLKAGLQSRNARKFNISLIIATGY
jgi:hypothetical protein